MSRILFLFWLLCLLFVMLPVSVNASESECSPETIEVMLSNTSDSIKVYAGQPTLFRLEDTYPEATLWFLNGLEVQSGESSQFCLSLPRTGHHTLEVRRAFDNSTIRAKLEIVSYQNIQLATITPKTNEETQESFTLSNLNPFLARLKDWSLRSESSKTRIAININMQPNETVTIKTNNRLNNSGGTYGLYNESDTLVDIVTYARVQPGEIIRRDGIFWPQSESEPVKSNKKSENADDKTNTRTEVNGVVVLPNGRTIDIRTDTGEIFRIVLHSSYMEEKPRLHKGDRIFASGIWKQSKRGWYISVREGHTFTLLYELNRRATQNKASKIVMTALNQPEEIPTHGLNPVRKMVPAVLSDVSLPISTPSPFWWIITIVTILSSGLALPYRLEKFV